MKLYCVRHGIACGSEVNPARPLTDLGAMEVANIAGYLSQRGVVIDHIMHSCQLRATETAALFAQAFPAACITVCDTLLTEQGDIEPLLAVIAAMEEDTLLVGHLPFLLKLISTLVAGDVNLSPIVKFSPGTVICLEHGQNGRWVINWLLSPAMV